MQRTILAATLFIGLAGCVSWPPDGHGGAAEFTRVAANRPVAGVRLTTARDKLSVLRAQGAGELLPAAMETAGVQWNRALRAAEGGFIKSANADLGQLEKMLAELQNAMRTNLSDAGELIQLQRNEVSR